MSHVHYFYKLILILIFYDDTIIIALRNSLSYYALCIVISYYIMVSYGTLNIFEFLEEQNVI